jgi:hypothetical protein
LRLPSPVLPNTLRLLRLWLMAETAIFLFGCLPWLVAAGLSVMAFGAPGSSVNLRAWLYALPLWSYPTWAIVPLLLARRASGSGRVGMTAMLLLLPLLVIAAYLAALVTGSTGL